MASAKKRIFILVIVLLVIGGIVAYVLTRGGAQANELILHGNVDIRQVELAFNASDRIKTLEVEEGDAVTKGQLLGVLETERLRQAAARAEAQVEAQAQVVARLRAGSREEEIRQARAQVAAGDARAVNAKLHFERMKELFAGGAINQQTLDDAKAAYDAAEAELKALQETLALAVAGPRKEDIASAEAALKAAQAEAALAAQNLKDAQLYAPADGIIQARILEPGDMASPSRPAFTLAMMDPLWVRVFIPETELGKVKPGMKAWAATDTYPDKRYEGWVGYISPTAQFTPKTVQTPEVRTTLVYEARVFIHNPEGELRLGMPATVIIPLDPTKAEHE